MSFPDYLQLVPRMDNESNNWLSNSSFKYDLNDGYNSFANNLLDWIFPKHSEFSGYSLNPENLLDFKSIDGNNLIWSNNGPVGLVSVGLVLSLAMLFGGIIWCIIKFCCCCLRSTDDYSDDEVSIIGDGESKRENIARISCGVGLGIWILLTLTVLFGCFVANEQLRTAISDLPKDVDNSLHDTELYLNVTKNQIRGIFMESYDVFASKVLESLGPVRNSELSDKILEGMNVIKGDVSKLQNNFRMASSEFNQNQIEFSKLFEKCKSESCQDMEEEVLKAYPMAATYNILTTTISKVIENGINTVRISKVKNTEVEKWEKAIKVVKDELFINAGELINALDQVPIRDVRDEIQNIDEEMQDLVSYLYYTLLFICIFLLLITVSLMIGGMLGCCGKRSRRSSCGTKRSGGTFLNCGIFSMFLVGWILWILALAAFILSGFMTQIICEAVRDLENDNSTMTTTENPFDLSFGKLQLLTDGGPEITANEWKLPTYGSIVQKCKNGQSAYATFDLELAYNVSEMLTLESKFPNNLDKSQDSYSKKTQIINSFKDIQIQLQKISKELKTTKESLGPDMLNLYELRELSKDLRITQIKAQFETAFQNLDVLQKSYAMLIQENVEKLGGNVDGIIELIPILINFYSKATHVIGIPEAKEQISYYGQFIFNTTVYDLGQCGPLWVALDSTIELFCYKISAPVGAFWMSLSFVLLLFIPLIITGILLDKIYKRQYQTV